MHSTAERIDELEHEIAVNDGAATDEDLADVAELLARQSILPTLAGVLSDPSEPKPVRMRALSRAMAALRWADCPSEAAS
jgi:hypothetical protein